jgi:hypothetical protein
MLLQYMSQSPEIFWEVAALCWWDINVRNLSPIYNVHLTTLTLTQDIRHRMVEGLVSSELKIMWKEAVVSSFDILMCYFPRGTE